jgi:hypothetical protein
MDNLIKVAIAELGQKEIPGAEDNAAIVRYAHESGFNWINDDETPGYLQDNGLIALSLVM